MTDTNIYETISQRCGGNIYIGVVGPVRTGKSTFIRRFLDTVVLPGIENEYDRERTMDEIPQSGSGKTITTTEPKFIPSEAVEINACGTRLSARLIDCVGYTVDGACGATEDGEERMVMTPWAQTPIPFSRAGEIGTERVVKEHSTIAMLVTTDGSICDIPRECYVSAEQRAAKELSEAGTPFAIILNSAHPDSDEAHELAEELEAKYEAPVALVSCERLNAEDALGILSLVVGEFPVKELTFYIPEWVSALPAEHRISRDIRTKIDEFTAGVTKLSHIDSALKKHTDIEKISLDAAGGFGEFTLPLTTNVYYSALKELTGIEITGEKDLFARLVELSQIKQDYDKISAALSDAREHGYGIVMPSYEQIELSEPQLQKQATGYGIKVCARAESYHIIKTDLKADICPVVGSLEQSEEVVKTMRSEFDEDPRRLLETKLFGRSLYDLVNDGMNAKMIHIPSEARGKLSKTIERIMNEGADGLICILL